MLPASRVRAPNHVYDDHHGLSPGRGGRLGRRARLRALPTRAPSASLAEPALGRERGGTRGKAGRIDRMPDLPDAGGTGGRGRVQAHRDVHRGNGARGVDRDGDEFRIDRQYLAHGMRWRAQEILTRELGRRSERDLSADRAFDVGREGFTEIDRVIGDHSSPDGSVTLAKLLAAPEGALGHESFNTKAESNAKREAVAGAQQKRALAVLTGGKLAS